MDNSFSGRLYAVIKKIPKGRVVTYKDVAIALGQPKACRAVGNALNKNPYLGIIPCHRVVRSSGGLGGYVVGEKRKSELLRQEGIVIKNGKIDLKKFSGKIK